MHSEKVKARAELGPFETKLEKYLMQLSLSSALAAHHSACEVKVWMFQLRPGHRLCDTAQEGAALALGAGPPLQLQPEPKHRIS